MGEDEGGYKNQVLHRLEYFLQIPTDQMEMEELDLKKEIGISKTVINGQSSK